MRIPNAVIAIALTVSGGAAAQEYTPPKVGLTIEYRDQVTGGPVFGSGSSAYTIVICAAEADTIVTCSRPNDSPKWQQRTFRGIHSLGSVGYDNETRLDSDVAPLRALWPMAIGKGADVIARLRIRDLMTSGKGAWQDRGSFRYAFRIEGEEHIALPVGRFHTWIIAENVERSDSSVTSRRISTVRMWFAPKLGWYVKMETRGSSGNLLREAVRISEQ